MMVVVVLLLLLYIITLERVGCCPKQSILKLFWCESVVSRHGGGLSSTDIIDRGASSMMLLLVTLGSVDTGV